MTKHFATLAMKVCLILTMTVCTVTEAASEKHATRLVYLDQPGALEAIEAKNPEHFVKIQRILQEAPFLPIQFMRGWIRTQFDAKDVANVFLIKTSFPPKAMLSFVLDDTKYQTEITLMNTAGKVVPAK